MNEIIKINNDNNDRPTVMGRELHKALEIKARYNDWFKRMCEYGFAENSDYITLTQKRVTAQKNEVTYTDHQLTIDMAKEICMIQRSDIGRKCRQYFIEVEKQWNSPEAIMGRALKYAGQKIKQLEQERDNTPISAQQAEELKKEMRIKSIDLCSSGRLYDDIGIEIKIELRRELCKAMNVKEVEQIVVGQFDAAIEFCRTFKPDTMLRTTIDARRLQLKAMKGA
ncbi:MAG: antA/AntB antirepressor family protein [Ruminococcus sp.]|uniref:antA/AntB antirepressor family protein n=1 Tax=Ruminococcus sp. TaxID=41978 RepID=UPI0025E7012C|nr:antA/AntB antirepressor family protein [Ruminococcus sp.]MCR5601558.1 antA/AntB antirepressor family protein [Ruminococcus sp.]